MKRILAAAAPGFAQAPKSGVAKLAELQSQDNVDLRP